MKGLFRALAGLMPTGGSSASPPSRRAAAAGAFSGFEGGQSRRRLAQWMPTRQHINGILAGSSGLVVARNRDLVRNNAYAGSGAESFAANLVGTGIMPSPLWTDAELRRQAKELWRRSTDEMDADGLTDFYGQQALAAHALFEAGEIFLRFRPRRPSDGLAVPLQLQAIEAEQCPADLNRQINGGRVIRNGIEFDPIGRRDAYWFYRSHPGDQLAGALGGAEMVRVPAAEVIHLFHATRPGQVRGVSRLTRAMVRLFLLDQYDDAELEKKKVAAAVTGIVTQSPEVPDAQETEAEDDDGASDLELETGTLFRLQVGEDIKFPQTPDAGANYDAFQYRNLLAACSAMGLPYASVTGDLKGANYSSLRAGLLELRRRIEQQQHAVLVFQMCRPVWRRWLDTAVLAGALRLPGYARDRTSWLAVKWITPKWEWVDPLKDRTAEKLAVDAGFKARADVVEAEGYDVEETDARIAEDRRRERELGLSFKVAAPAKPQAPDPAKERDERDDQADGQPPQQETA